MGMRNSLQHENLEGVVNYWLFQQQKSMKTGVRGQGTVSVVYSRLQYDFSLAEQLILKA